MLIDTFDRKVSYLRISVTDRCDFRCTYCMNEKMQFLPRKQILSLEEIVEVASVFVDLGVKKIRITGGEPLVRKGIVGLLEKLAKLKGLDELVMTTNGASLEKLAGPIRDAGVSRINVSLDSLKAERFKEITRTGDLSKVLRGIEAAKKAGFDSIKLNSVIMKGFNEDEITDLLRFAVNERIDITYIEEMPLGTMKEHNRQYSYLSSDEVEKVIAQNYVLKPLSSKSLAQSDGSAQLDGPARKFQLFEKSDDTLSLSTRLGLISPHSHNFCSTCNRVRITAEGRLLLCLGNEHSLDLREMIRHPDYTQAILREALLQSMQIKPKQHEFDLQETKIVRFMNMTGG